MRKNEILFWTIFLLCLVHHLWISRDLPEIMATHFGADGLANGFSSRDGHRYGMLLLYGVMGLSFGVLPFAFKWIPPQLINLPHREFWLAPERREQSLGRLRDWMAIMGVAMFFFFMVVDRLVVEANQIKPPRLPDSFLWALGLFIGFTLAWAVVLFMAFRKPVMASPRNHQPPRRP